MNTFDRSRWSELAGLGYLSVFLPPAIMVVGHHFGADYCMIVAFFVVFPLFRLVLGDVPPHQPAWSECWTAFLDAIPRAFAIWYPLFLIWVLSAVRDLSDDNLGRQISFGVSFWLVASLATCPTHALVHSGIRGDRRLGSFLAAMVGYPVLPYEHILHHAAARSTSDAESPRLRHSLGRFILLRYVSAQLRGLEWAAVLRLRTGQTSPFEHALTYVVLTVALWLGFFYFAGVLGLVIYGAAVIFVPVTVSIITYLQHWGLGDVDQADFGPGEQLAWEDGCRFQAWLLLGLSLHQSHHDFSSAPYYRLTLAKHSPRLPASYSVMLFVAMVPSLWRSVMNRALQQWRERSPETYESYGKRPCFTLSRQDGRAQAVKR